MTNGGRGHSARCWYRSEGKRERVREGLSLDSPWSASLCPGHLIRPRRGSFVFLVFQRRAAAPGRAVFSFCSCDLSPGLSVSLPFSLSSPPPLDPSRRSRRRRRRHRRRRPWSSLAPRTYSPDVLESKFDDEDKSSSRIPDVRDGRVNDRHCVDSLDDDCTALARTVRFIQSTSLSMTTLAD